MVWRTGPGLGSNSVIKDLLNWGKILADVAGKTTNAELFRNSIYMHVLATEFQRLCLPCKERI
jgi:hypothetical protein